MKTTYIQLYRSNAKKIKVLKAFAFILAIFGFTGVAAHFLISEYTLPGLSVWNYFIFIFQGFITWFLVDEAKKRDRFFISWNKEEIRYLFPKSNRAEKIRIEEIISIQINSKEIQLELKNGVEKRINLNFVFHPKRERVSEYFVGLKDNLERRDTQNLIRGLPEKGNRHPSIFRQFGCAQYGVAPNA